MKIKKINLIIFLRKNKNIIILYMTEVKKTRKPRTKKETKPEPKNELEVEPITEHIKVADIVDKEHKDVPSSPEKKKDTEKKVKVSKKNGRPCKDNKGNVIYE